jgi:hypothetical protein
MAYGSILIQFCGESRPKRRPEFPYSVPTWGSPQNCNKSGVWSRTTSPISYFIGNYFCNSGIFTTFCRVLHLDYILRLTGRHPQQTGLSQYRINVRLMFTFKTLMFFIFQHFWEQPSNEIFSKNKYTFSTFNLEKYF